MRVDEHSSASSLWVFEKIKTTDKNGWTHIRVQVVSSLVVFDQIRTTDKNGWNTSRKWVQVALQCLTTSKSLTMMHLVCELLSLPLKYLSRSAWENNWTCIQHVSLLSSILSRSEPLTGMAECTSSKWVPSPVFKQFGITDKNFQTCIQEVSCYPIFKQMRNTGTDKNDWKHTRSWVPL